MTLIRVSIGLESRALLCSGAKSPYKQNGHRDALPKSIYSSAIRSEMSESAEIENLKKEFENPAAELKEAKGRDTTGSGTASNPLNHASRHDFL